MTDKVNAREIVLDMLPSIIEGDKFTHTVLNQTLKRYQGLEKQERAFIARLCTGTVKHYLTIDYILDSFASLPVNKMKPLIRNLLRLSVYQLKYMDQVPVSAVCNEAVKLAKKRGFTKLSGFVNGLLRNIARNIDAVAYPNKVKEPSLYLSVSYSVPIWLVKELLLQYEFEIVEELLKASLHEKETTIRCNRRRISPEKLKEALIAEGVTVEDSEYLSYAFKIKDYDYLEKLESFRFGYFAVQDVSSMLVCHTAGVKETDYVIDVCAAPGGKATHAAELADKVSARDLTEYKTSLIKENRKRLQLTNLDVKTWDAAILDQEALYSADLVIADLPCSGLGVLGKKPDIKYKLTQNQQKELVELQRQILSVIKDYVKKGGILLYSTCTIDKRENLENLKWFLAEYQNEFELESLDEFLPKSLCDSHTKEGYLQLVPGVHNTDGFFLSKLRRKA